MFSFDSRVPFYLGKLLPPAILRGISDRFLNEARTRSHAYGKRLLCESKYFRYTVRLPPLYANLVRCLWNSHSEEALTNDFSFRVLVRMYLFCVIGFTTTSNAMQTTVKVQTILIHRLGSFGL